MVGFSVFLGYAGDIRNPGSIPGLGRPPGEGNGYPLRYSCWEIPWTEEPGRLQSPGHKESDTTECLTLHFGYFMI